MQLECADCHQPILEGAPFIGHFTRDRQNVEHLCHQACVIAKIAILHICPICQGQFDLRGLPSPQKEQVLTAIEEYKILKAVEKDSLKWGMIAGLAGGLLTGGIVYAGVMSCYVFAAYPLIPAACLLAMGVYSFK